MKCRSRRRPAVIDIPRHNAGFCHPCFVKHCREQVSRTIESFEMFHPDDRVLVAVSGGKAPEADRLHPRPGCVSPTVGDLCASCKLVDRGGADVSGAFAAGERALLFDSKGRRYLVALTKGGEFHTHSGPVSHDELIGQEEGVQVKSSRGARYTAVRPTLAEVVLKMPRGAQVIYPKDLGPLLMMADVFPGSRVFESGLGSGALSMTLLRAGADVTGYELRPDFADRARANVTGFLGEAALERYHVEVRDAYEGIEQGGFDRAILDLPEPWRVVKAAQASLRPGGILVSYLPTIGQVSIFREALDRSGFGLAETIEVLQRSWHIEGQSVRPDHRMVAHTGFLTSARLLHASALSESAD